MWGGKSSVLQATMASADRNGHRSSPRTDAAWENSPRTDDEVASSSSVSGSMPPTATASRGLGGVGLGAGGQGQVAAAVEGRLRGLEERQRLLTQSVMEMDSVKSRAHKLERRYEQGWVEVGVRLCLCARSPPPTPGPST